MFATKDAATITQIQRGPHGGHLVFRPVGLDIVTRTAVELAKTRGIKLPDAVDLLKNLPTDLTAAPYCNVLWDPNRHTMIPRGKTLANNLVKYMAGLTVDEDELKAEYVLAAGAKAELPAQLQ